MVKVIRNGLVFCENSRGKFEDCKNWIYDSARCPDCPLQKVITSYIIRQKHLENAASECPDSV